MSISYVWVNGLVPCQCAKPLSFWIYNFGHSWCLSTVNPNDMPVNHQLLRNRYISAVAQAIKLQKMPLQHKCSRGGHTQAKRHLVYIHVLFIIADTPLIPCTL